MIFILLLCLTFLYVQFGLLVLLQIILLLIVLLASNILIGINPLSKELHIIRVILILVIMLVLYYNTQQIAIITSFIFPLSINRVTFFHELDGTKVIDPDIQIEVIKSVNFYKTSDLITKLDLNQNYIVTIEFIPDLSLYSVDDPQMFLSEPIAINRLSSPATITKFIHERLDSMVDDYYLDDEIIQDNDSVVLITYTKFYL